MRRELEEQFSPEQGEEGLKRLEWIIRVRDRGEDCQTALNELGIALSVNSHASRKNTLRSAGKEKKVRVKSSDCVIVHTNL